MIENLLMFGVLAFFVGLSTQSSFAQKGDHQGGGQIVLKDGRVDLYDYSSTGTYRLGKDILSANSYGIATKIKALAEIGKSSPAADRLAKHLTKRLESLKLYTASSIDEKITERERNQLEKFTIIDKRDALMKPTGYLVILGTDTLSISDRISTFDLGTPALAIIKVLVDEIVCGDLEVYRRDSHLVQRAILNAPLLSAESFEALMKPVVFQYPSQN